MKKIIAAAISLALILCGCSMNTEQEPDTTANKESNTSESSTSGVENTAPDVTGIGLDLSGYDTASVTWGPGNITNHERPKDPTDLQEKFADLNSQWLLEDSKNICLTFDEGYENGFTGQILDTLKEKNVKAIFFCTYDYVRDNPDLVQRMIDEGHIVGNHSYTHYNFTEIDLETAQDEVTILHDYVAQNFAYEMNYFRFPEGEFSQQSLALVKSLGYKSVFWSFAYADWDTSSPPDPETAYNKITSSAHNGEIMLLHAVSSTNAEILGSVIDNIREQGYTFTLEL